MVRVLHKILSIQKSLLTQNSEAIVERHDHDFADGGQDAAVVRIARSPAVRFTVDEHDDGVARPQGGRTRCKSICEEKKNFQLENLIIQFHSRSCWRQTNL